MFSWEIHQIFKKNSFYGLSPVAASEERITEEVRNLPCLYDKGNTMLQRKKLVKERMAWDGECILHTTFSRLFYLF